MPVPSSFLFKGTPVVIEVEALDLHKIPEIKEIPRFCKRDAYICLGSSGTLEPAAVKIMENVISHAIELLCEEDFAGSELTQTGYTADILP
ncbi:MAG: hypothetical protein JWR54_559 [Mucilaginibacter sp.]|nr:hypothetical protein [Mucilaginibacter sp.]